MKRLCGYSRVVANAFQRKWKLCVAILCATILLETMTIILGYRFSAAEDEEMPEDFLTQYETYCERSLLPRGWYIMPGPSSEIIPVYGNPNDSVNLKLSSLPSPGSSPNHQRQNVVNVSDRGNVITNAGYRSSTPPSDSGLSLCSCVSSELGKCT